MEKRADGRQPLRFRGNQDPRSGSRQQTRLVWLLRLRGREVRLHGRQHIRLSSGSPTISFVRRRWPDCGLRSRSHLLRLRYRWRYERWTGDSTIRRAANCRRHSCRRRCFEQRGDADQRRGFRTIREIQVMVRVGNEDRRPASGLPMSYTASRTCHRRARTSSLLGSGGPSASWPYLDGLPLITDCRIDEAADCGSVGFSSSTSLRRYISTSSSHQWTIPMMHRASAGTESWPKVHDT